MANVLASAHSTPLLVSEAPYPYPQDHATSHTNINDHTAKNRDDDDDEKWIWVLDPMTRKLRVPVHLLNPTQATATSGTVPSLCIAYLEGRCRHPWCRQAHVLPSAIPQLRYEALNAPTCCHLHNDPHDISKLTNRFRYIRIVNNGPSGDSELIPTDRVASTVGLLRYLVHNVLPKKNEEAQSGNTSAKDKTEADSCSNSNTNSTTSVNGAAQDDVLELPAKFICRLHLAHRCRYLEDCNNIHLCREYELQLQPPPHILGALSGVTTSTRTVTVGDTCYAVTPLAVGEVSDEDFHAINEAQKIHHQNTNATAPSNNGATPAGHVNASSMPWMMLSNPLDSAVPSTTGNSPMLYARGGALTPLSGPANANSSGTVFPSVPDCWQIPSAVGSAVPGSSPYLQSAGYPNSTAATPSTHLRVYDVRPKNANHSNSNVSNSTANCQSHNAAAAEATLTKTTPTGTSSATTNTTPSGSTPGSVNPVSGGNADEKGAAGIAAATTATPALMSALVGIGKHGMTACSSTDGGASISSSGANTPVTDGAFAAFLQRIVETPSL